VNLKEKVKALPSCPGVYLMRDSFDNIIYVGKSKNLKSRVGSYFLNSKFHSPKVLKMVRSLKDFDYTVTDTEFEALLLECKFIKQLKPFYNRLLKNTRAYTYIRISYGEKYPVVEISEEAVRDDKNLYLGPYTNRNTVQRALEGLKEYCRISCSGNPGKAAPCLNYSLGLCIGMCMESTPGEQYLSILDKISGLLGGTDNSLLKEMEAHMERASERLDFEYAARYRDYIGAVKHLLGKARVMKYAKKNRNIVVLESLDDNSCKAFLIKGNKLLCSERFMSGSFSPEKIKSVLKKNILTHFGSKAADIPAEIGREEIDEYQIIYSYLNSSSNSCRHVTIPKKWLLPSEGQKLDRALDKLLAACHHEKAEGV
jgi:excinuclease ABC subunit C